MILHFLPAKIESLLADLEKSHAGDKVAAVLSTRFGVRQKRNGFELTVFEQTSR